MSNKLLMKIIMVLVVLICIFLLIYTFTKPDDAKKDNVNNYSEPKTENNLEDKKTPTLDTNEENNDEVPEQKPADSEATEQKPSDDEALNDNTESSSNGSEIIDNKKIILEDRTKGTNCAQAIEYFYEDREYRYYFTCIKSNNMYVIVDKKEYKLVYALNNGIVTIQELEKNGYKFAKESKNLQDR